MRGAPLSIAMCLALFSPAIVATAANQVLVVDASGGPGLYATIQAAIDAATDGDVVLVRPGNYAGFGVVGKGVSVVAEAGGVRPKTGRAAIWSLPAGRHATLRGLEIAPPSPIFGKQGEAVSLQACQGSVLVEDCVIRSELSPGMYVILCDRAVITRCTLSAKNGPALSLNAASISAFESSFTGGAGTDAAVFGTSLIPAGQGADAIWVSSSFLALGGSTATGGAGGKGVLTSTGVCSPGASGGAGVFVFGLGPELVHFDNTLAGGQGGAAAPGCSNGGPQGVPIKVQNGSATALSATLRTLSVSSPVRAGQAATVTVSGQPGESAFLIAGAPLSAQWIQPLVGALLPSIFVVYPLGPLPAGGSLQFAVPLPASILPPGLQSLEAWVQVIVPGPFGAGVLGDGSGVVVLDASL